MHYCLSDLHITLKLVSFQYIHGPNINKHNLGHSGFSVFRDSSRD